MGVITSTSIYDEPVRFRFDERKTTSAAMRAAVDRAFVMSSEARVAAAHDFGLGKPVRMMPVGDYYLTSASGLAKHLVVLTRPGGHLMLYLVDVGSRYECLAGSAYDIREFVSRTVAPSYASLAFDIEQGKWRDTFAVDGLVTLHCAEDGEFCGAIIEGNHFVYTGELEDTTAQWMLDIEDSEVNELPDLTDDGFVEAVLRLEEAQAA